MKKKFIALFLLSASFAAPVFSGYDDPYTDGINEGAIGNYDDPYTDGVNEGAW